MRDPAGNQATDRCLDPVVIDLERLAERLAALVLAHLGSLANPASPWLDVRGAAAHLGFPVERIRKLIAANRIPFHQDVPGGRISFHRDELDQWLLNL